MRNNTYIIILAFILCLIPMNYGCSLVSKAVKLSSKTVFKNSFSKVSKYTGKYGKYVFGKGAKFFVEPAVEIKKIAGRINSKFLKKTTTKIGDAKAAKKTLYANIKNDIKYFDGKLSQKAFQKLRKDVAKNPSLIIELKRNPNAIKIYENAVESKYGNDITFLRYWANNSDKYFDKGFKQFGKGEDIVFKDINGITEITDKAGAKLGIIINKSDGYQYAIDITNAEKNTLTNLYPMANAKYIKGNETYLTDKFGRVIECRVKIDNTVQKFGRDDNMIKKIRNVKIQYGADGNQLSNIHSNDQGGHIIADSWGGSSDAINIIPQNNKINLGGIWRQTEQSGLDVAREGNQVERIIKLKYPDNNSLRPSEFILEQKVNGSYDIKGGLKPYTIMNNDITIFDTF